MRKLIPILLSGWSVGSLQKRRARQEKLARSARLPKGISCTPIMVDGVPAEWIAGPNANESVMVYLHGGAYNLGSIQSHREVVARLANATGMRALALEYRLAPEHPFPAALEDVIDAYQWLLNQGWNANQIILAGDSAGGGLALATLVSLRDSELPLPAGAACFSPWTDLTCSAPSYEIKASVDKILSKDVLQAYAEQYAGSQDRASPLISPLYADLRGLPPLLLQVGSEEVLLDDSIRFSEHAREAGVDVSLDIYPGAFHVFIMVPFLPESQDAQARFKEFAAQIIEDHREQK